MVILNEPLKSKWEGKDVFKIIDSLSGEVYRNVGTRRTIQFELDNKKFFLKHHIGTTWKEIFKNLIRLRLPIIGATNEWKAIHRLKELGVDTLEGVAFGKRGLLPTEQESFIVTKDISPSISLEDYCKDWKTNPPNPKVKRQLIKRVAQMVRKMHQGGVNHRDCYICHFLLDLPYSGDEESLKISLIDLHRAQIRDAVPTRWRDKDLVGLYFSSLNIGLTRTDYFFFLKEYFQLPLKEIFIKEKAFFDALGKKTKKIKRHTEKWKL